MKQVIFLKKNDKKSYYFNKFRAYKDCHDLAKYFSQKWKAQVQINLDVGYRVDYLIDIDENLFTLSYDDYDGNFLTFDDESHDIVNKIISEMENDLRT